MITSINQNHRIKTPKTRLDRGQLKMEILTKNQIKAIVTQAARDFSAQSSKHITKTKPDFFQALEEGLMDIISPEQIDLTRVVYEGAFASFVEGSK